MRSPGLKRTRHFSIRRVEHDQPQHIQHKLLTIAKVSIP